MFHSRLITTFALLLALAYALTGICVAAPAATTAHHAPAAPCGGCHGHNQHVPTTPRYCCANPQAPAALQASAFAAPCNAGRYRQAGELISSSDSVTAIPINGSQVSFSPPAVLRI